MSDPSQKTEVRLRFRINMLLAERDMTLKDLYDRVKKLGSNISSSHFYRQMKPYHSPMRMDLMTMVVQALKVQPSELFDLVEVEVDDKDEDRKMIHKAEIAPEPIEEKEESEKVKKARKTAKQKRELAMLGTKISVLPNNKK